MSLFKGIDVNITGFRMVDTDNPKTKEYLKEWKYPSSDKGNFAKGRAHPLFVSTFQISNFYHCKFPRMEM